MVGERSKLLLQSLVIPAAVGIVQQGKLEGQPKLSSLGLPHPGYRLAQP